MNGIRSGLRFPVTRTPTLIGRGVDTDVTIPDLTLSRHHAKIYISSNMAIMLEDVGSSNGSFVEDKRLEAKQPRVVTVGSLIRLGSVNMCANPTLQNPHGPGHHRDRSADSDSPLGSRRNSVNKLSPRAADLRDINEPKQCMSPRLISQGSFSKDRRPSVADDPRIKTDVITAGRRLNAVLRISEILGLRSFSEDMAESIVTDVLDVMLHLFTNAHQVMLLRGRSERSLRFINARARERTTAQRSPDADLEQQEAFNCVTEFRVPRALVKAGFDRCRVVALPPRNHSLGGDDHGGLQSINDNPATTLAPHRTSAASQLPSMMCIPLLVRAPNGSKTSSLHSTLYGPSMTLKSSQQRGHEFLGLVVIEGMTDFQFTKKDMEIATAVGHQLSVALKSQQLVWEATTNANIRRSLCKYLPRPLVDQVIAGKKDLVPQVVHATVLFADIVGFTALSEKMPPTELIGLMNQYFSDAVPCISFESGSVDKFIGDAIMALYGISHYLQHGVSDTESPLRAVRSSLNMQNRVFSFHHASMNAPLMLGIGIHTGPMVAGNIGAIDRMEYTVLGDVVNTTQRIESTAMAGAILISENSYRTSIDHLAARGAGQPGACMCAVRMPNVMVKNRQTPVELLSIRGTYEQRSTDYVLSVPCIFGGHSVRLTQRVDGPSPTFVILHKSTLMITEGPLALHLPEIDLEPVAITKRLSTYPEGDQEGDDDDARRLGTLSCKIFMCKSVVELDDPTLRGLLDQTEPLQSGKDWSEMPRRPEGTSPAE